MYVTSIRMWKSSAQKNHCNEFHIFDRELVLGGRRKSFVVFVKNIPHFRKSNE